MSLYQISLNKIEEYLDENGDVKTTLNDITLNEEAAQKLNFLRITQNDLVWL